VAYSLGHPVHLQHSAGRVTLTEMHMR